MSLTVNANCWHALPMGIPATLMLAPGCSMALAVLLALRDEGRELPAGCILLSPWGCRRC